jgi:hypothetical protein
VSLARVMRRKSWILVAAGLLPVAYQVRYSIATVEASQTFLYLPFRLKPFTNIIESVTMPARYDVNGTRVGLQRGDELIAINGRPFVGAGVLSQELRSARRYLDGISQMAPQQQTEAILKWPFVVTVRSGATERTTPVYFANCTCGRLGQTRVWWYSIIPPAACVLAGLIAIGRARGERRAWVFFAMTLCLSQIALVPGGFGDWSQAAYPTEWRDWFRVPALADHTFFTISWPAWLLLYACYSFKPWDNRFTKSVVALLMVVAVFDTGLAVGWSEAFRSVSIMSSFAEAVKPFVSPVALLLVSVTTFKLPKPWVVATVSMALVSIAALNAPVTPYDLVRYANTGQVYVELVHPLFVFRTTDVIFACFAIAMFLVAVGANWRSRDLVRDAGLFFMLAALVYRAASTVWGVWWMSPLPQLALGAIYAGVILSVLSLMRRTPHELPSVG